MTPITLHHSFNYGDCLYNVYHPFKNEGLLKHQHSFNHAVICHSGSCLVTLEGRSYTMDKNSQPLDLPANEWHEIEALEDNTVFVTILKQGTY